MRLTTLPILAASLGLAVGGSWLFHTLSAEHAPAGSPTPVHAEPGEEVRALEGQVDALRREVAALGRHPAKLPEQPDQADGRSAQPAPSEPEPSKAPEASDDERRQAAKETHDKGVKRLEGIMQRDAKDPQWTSQMQQEVTSAVPVDSGSALHAVDCHGSLCRVELTHEDRPALERFTDDLSNNLHYDMDILIEPSGQSFQSVVFLSRQGQPMPNWRREMAEEMN